MTDHNAPLEQLTADQRAAVLARLREARRGQSDIPALEPMTDDGVAPLSHIQRSMWFLEQLATDRAVYNTTQALKLSGPVNPDFINTALATVVERHQVLRSRFVTTDNELGQEVLPPPGAPLLTILDWRSNAANQQQAELEALLSSEASRRIDLTSGRMLHATLIRLADDEHVLILATHHAVTDGWSTGLLVQELTTAYAALSQGVAPILPQLPVQYRDYASWQQAYLSSEAGRRDLSYWIQRLAGLPSLNLPTDRPRPSSPTWSGELEQLHLSAETHRAVSHLAATHRVTCFTVLVAALNVLAARYTGQDDVVLGSVFSGRTRQELEPLVGYFANTVVLRTSLAGNPRFTDVLSRVDDTLSGAHSHQDIPFDLVVSELHPDRDTSRNPLFQNAIYQISGDVRDLSMGGVTIDGIPVPSGSTKFDWTVGVTELPNLGGIDLMVEYSTELYDAGTIVEMLRHLELILAHVVHEPDATLGSIPLTPKESPANPPLTGADPEETLIDLLAHHQTGSADKIAIVGDRDTVTYREMSHGQEALKRHLLELGVRAGDRVAVCMERNPRQIVAMAAVMAAGAAYVPLNPQHPGERLRGLLADAEPAAIIVDRTTATLLAGGHTPTLNVDDAPLAPLSAPPIQNNPRPEATDVAYVMYTSGSTGHPKGVLVEHRQLISLFEGLAPRLGDKPPVFLALSSTSFDMSVVEVWWTLSRGGTVIFASSETRDLLRSTPGIPSRPLDFGLFYFGSDAGDEPGSERYKCLIDGARFADRHGFSAVWTPERHFHQFGGLYPAPSITAAAIAMVTERISIRSGSVVLPLHHPVRVAEEWSVIDNLSDGRVGMAFASGWLHDDFLFAPDAYDNRKNVMLENAEIVRHLWRGGEHTTRAGKGQSVTISTLPRPVQSELPCWLSSGGSEDTFIAAAKAKMNVITHLLGQDLKELRRLIALYHAAWEEHHGSPGGHVTLMLHTFLDEDRDVALATAREPFINYLRTSLGLVKVLGARMGMDVDPANITDDDLDALLNHAYERYVHESGLFGTVEDCLPLVGQLQDAGVDELACLIDFGIDDDQVLSGLAHLDKLRQRFSPTEAPQEVSDLIDRHGVTHLQCTPSTLQLLLASQSTRQSLAALEFLLVGGESIPGPLMADTLSATQAQVHAMYGPTEATVWVSSRRVVDSDAVAPTVPLGSAFPHNQLDVVDQWGNLQPVGVPGELRITGANVARGYLHPPQSPGRTFVDGPPRHYYTGDLAKVRRDGELEFLGRIDTQMKIRGYRIEAAEVERALATVPGVSGATVIARGEVGNQQLVAFLTGSPVEAGQLRATLGQFLPDYMIPTQFKWLSQFPLNHNGKVDRAKLPTEGLSSEREPATPPRGPVETALVDIWQTVLGVSRVGTNENFFELGGHSISVIRAVDLSVKRGLNVSARQIFTHQTIRELASVISVDEGDIVLPGGLVTLRPGNEAPIYCLHSSSGSATPYVPLAAASRPGPRWMALEYPGGFEETSISELADIYVERIIDDAPEGAVNLIGWSLGGALAWDVAVRLIQRGRQVGRLVLLDCQAPTMLDQPLGWEQAAVAYADSFALALGHDRLKLDPGTLEGLEPAEQIRSVVSSLEAAGLAQSAERELVRDRAHTFVVLTRAASVWQPSGYSGDVLLFLSEDSSADDDVAHGWQSHVAGSLAVAHASGHHFSMLQPPHVAALARALDSCQDTKTAPDPR